MTAIPTCLSTLISNGFYEKLIGSSYMFLIGIIHFFASFFIMYYFVKKFKVAEGGNIVFKKAFGYTFKVVLSWSFFTLIVSYIYAITNKELLEKIARSSIEIQKQRILSNSGSIPAAQMKVYDQMFEMQSNPLYHTFMSFIAIIFIGTLFSLIISAIVKTKATEA